MSRFYNGFVTPFEPAAYQSIQAFAVSLGIGLLIGLVSFPLFFAFQPDSIMPPIRVHADA